MDKIIICLVGSQSRPGCGPGRKACMALYPLSNLVSLDIDQADTLGCAADWANPALTPFGIALQKRPDLSGRYQANFHVLRRALRRELEGYTNVFTHNPWGEYGHEEHVQLYRVVKELQAEMKFDLWYSNYISNKSCQLMLQITDKSALPLHYMTLKTDSNLSTKIKKLYQDLNCWTWHQNWQGFSQEILYNESYVDNKSKQNEKILFPFNFIAERENIRSKMPLFYIFLIVKNLIRSTGKIWR